ncbi:DNA-binding response regulator [Bacillus sp. AFS018417]|uniref:response regulator transcription factor n=1 Tax=unclassified Bacillus (in: firmicutes) TaxID=185979 RepID=UPI000BF44E6C|nr:MULTISPECIES: response regulator transcription factor [unclassified Bacillus (in: firmicutes)]MCP1122970.1 response regulator transcription factor [Bacillus sp. 3103sda1]PEZ01606.1 DNA-binding response regulator [Bacillus sp. AFS018417]
MSKYKVLLVDDESDMRQLVGMYLDNFGYEWKEAQNGKQALHILETEDFDFVILDIMMPEMDGIAVCKEIRKTSDIPIIFLTAKGEEWNRVNGLRTGADDYIVKPFSPGELIARMEAVLRRYTKYEEQEEMEFGPIVVNEKSRRVEIENESISLTVKEFDLLYFLCQHNGQVFSREQLLEKVWGYDYAGSTRTVDTHVKTMRLKLKEQGNCIQTVWGVGYKFEV